MPPCWASFCPRPINPISDQQKNSLLLLIKPIDCTVTSLAYVYVSHSISVVHTRGIHGIPGLHSMLSSVLHREQPLSRI